MVAAQLGGTAGRHLLRCSSPRTAPEPNWGQTLRWGQAQAALPALSTCTAPRPAAAGLDMYTQDLFMMFTADMQAAFGAIAQGECACSARVAAPWARADASWCPKTRAIFFPMLTLPARALYARRGLRVLCHPWAAGKLTAPCCSMLHAASYNKSPHLPAPPAVQPTA